MTWTRAAVSKAPSSVPPSAPEAQAPALTRSVRETPALAFSPFAPRSKSNGLSSKAAPKATAVMSIAGHVTPRPLFADATVTAITAGLPMRVPSSQMAELFDNVLGESGSLSLDVSHDHTNFCGAPMDLAQVSRDVTKLMRQYGSAVAECKSVPFFSLWPFLKLVVLTWFWLFCLEIAFLVIFIDFVFLISRLFFSRPNIVVGKYFYDFVRKPFRSAWKGEIPAFRIVRIRYLTKLLVFYHARERIDKLRKAISAKHLDEIVVSGRYKLSEEEKGLQDNFDLFDTIVKDPYQLGALVVLGPALTVMSFVTQKILFPIVKGSLNLYSQLLFIIH